jgi:hypothetical protein
MENMISRTRITVILFTLLCTLPVRAWKVFPLLSYSTSSGVLLGGVINHNMIPPFSPFGFSAMAYGYTDGSISAEPQLLFRAGRGIARISIDYSVSREDKYFGWGNDGDNEVYELYDSEIQVFSGSYIFSPLSDLVLTAGLLCSHSTVYNRLDRPLWDDSPTEEYRSRWSAGPFVDGTWNIPAVINGYVSSGGNLQLGGETPYYTAETALALFAPAGNSTLPCFRAKIGRHVGLASTPFCFLPSLGGSTGLRGYSDSRFGGSWTLLGNLELRQRLFTVDLDEQNSMVFSLVLFGDAGQVADHLDECRWNRFHLDGGLGARITLPGGGSLRADFALSPEGLGIQMGLGELF